MGFYFIILDNNDFANVQFEHQENQYYSNDLLVCRNQVVECNIIISTTATYTEQNVDEPLRLFELETLRINELTIPVRYSRFILLLYY